MVTLDTPVGSATVKNDGRAGERPTTLPQDMATANQTTADAVKSLLSKTTELGLWLEPESLARNLEGHSQRDVLDALDRIANGEAGEAGEALIRKQRMGETWYQFEPAERRTEAV